MGEVIAFPGRALAAAARTVSTPKVALIAESGRVVLQVKPLAVPSVEVPTVGVDMVMTPEQARDIGRDLLALADTAEARPL